MQNESVEISGAVLRLVTVAALILCCTLTICAQQSSSGPQVEIKGIVGGVGFLAGDDATIGHSLVGAAVRIYVTKRLGIEPEYIYMRHDADDHDQAFNLNLSYDFRDRHTTKYVPYIIGGAGWTNNRIQSRGLVGTVTNKHDSWTANFGGGIKIFLTKGLFVAPEVRLGYEPLVRGSVNIGYVFPQKH
jgi:hypothetical protein